MQVRRDRSGLPHYRFMTSDAQVVFRIPSPLLDQLDGLAETARRSRSDLLRFAAEEYVARRMPVHDHTIDSAELDGHLLADLFAGCSEEDRRALAAILRRAAAATSDRVSVVVGESGVGKSQAMLDALAGKEEK